MSKESIVKCRCGEEFDLFKAPKCHHEPWTKMCPKGHCVCHLRRKEYKWRLATDKERALGFETMIKEEYGGVKKKQPKGVT